MLDLLSDLTVVEAGAGSAVAIAGRLFADAGAAVVKLRPEADDRPAAWAAALDGGKEMVAAGDASFAARLASARIALVGDPDPSWDPRALAPRRGLTVARVCARPGGERVDDLLVQAAGGMCAGIGEPARAPLKLPLDQSAQQGGLVLALAAAATLFGEEATELDVCELDVWAGFYSGPGVANARFGRSKTRRAGHRALGVVWPRTLLRCKDGYFAVQCATRDQWRRFLNLVGRPELESAPIFADRIKANDEHGDEAEALFADWFGARTKDEIAAAFIEAKIAGAPVYTIAEVATSAHLRGRDAFRTVPGAAGELVVPKLPFVLHDGPARTAPEDARPPGGTPRAPLAGLRVLDFGWVWAGAVPGHVLADLGAEVIKVETTTHLDYMRQGRPIVGKERDPEQNPMFTPTNRGKLSLRIDMTKPEGAALLRELAATCDVVVENFAPGVLARHGLGYDDLAAVNPDLVMCSMSAAGATGPMKDVRTYATMIAGLCGLDSMVGYPGERVLGSQSSYCDPNASLHAVFAILAALVRRRRSGRGCWIDLSQWEAGVRAVGEAVAAWSQDGIVPGPCGLERPDRFVHGTFPASGNDEWIAISLREPGDWDALRAALGDPAWMAQVRFGDAAVRRDVAERLAGETARFAAADLAARLGVRRAAPVLSQARMGKDPTIAGLDLFEEVEHPILGPIPVYRLPWRVDGERFPIRRRAPKLGEHNAYVLRELMGLPPARIAELEAAEVFV